MKKFWVLLLLVSFTFVVSAVESRIFNESEVHQIDGTWKTLLFFPYTINAWLDDNIYSEYILSKANNNYKNELADYLIKEPIFKEITFGEDNTGSIVFFSDNERKINIFYGESGNGNGSIRLISANGKELWVDYVHIEEDMLLMRVFTNMYATNNGYHIILKKID